MSEERKMILEKIDELPEKYKSYITGYAAGVIDAKSKPEDGNKKKALDIPPAG